jgi:trk system potassium uptake protein TrkA
VHIVIMGCGRVGSTLARMLEKHGETVSVIDIDADAFRRLGPDFHGHTIQGIGFDRDVLAKANIRDADGFAAVSSGDNSNIIAARVVHEEFGLDNVVARIYDHGRAEVYERLGIPAVATVRWSAIQVLNRLLPLTAEPVWRDPSGQTVVAQMSYDPHWVGRTLASLEQATHSRVAALLRLGQGIVPVPGLILQDGDVVYLTMITDRLSDVRRLMMAPPAA